MTFQTLGEGYEYLFRGDGCVAYADTGAAWVAAGPPIAASENLSAIANAFVEAARQVGHRCCFFGSEERFVRATSDVLLALPIGEQPVWEPRDWTHTLERHAELRGQLRRARAKGVRIRPLAGGEHTDSDTLGAAMQELIDQWIATRRMPPMGFFVRLEPPRMPALRRCFLAEREGRLVGLVYVVPVPQRRGWFIEHMVRAPFAPNGTVELLVDAVMRWASGQGSSWLTLGLVPLSGDVPPLLRMLRRRMSFLYNFDGLRHFKAKLCPTAWHPIYLSYPASQNVIGTVFDVLAAFAKSGPHGYSPLRGKLSRVAGCHSFVSGRGLTTCGLFLASVMQVLEFGLTGRRNREASGV